MSNMNKLRKYAGGAVWSLPEKVRRVFDDSSGVAIRGFDRRLTLTGKEKAC